MHEAHIHADARRACTHEARTDTRDNPGGWSEEEQRFKSSVANFFRGNEGRLSLPELILKADNIYRIFTEVDVSAATQGRVRKKTSK